NFMLVLILFTAGFVLALYYIISVDLSQESICTNDNEYRTKLLDLSSVMLYIIQTLLQLQDWVSISIRKNGTRQITCFGEERANVAEWIILLYNAVGTIILLNLLIALLASTFEAFKERAKIETNFSRVQDTIDTARKHAMMSPPFNLVVMVAMLVVMLFDYAIRLLSRGRYVLNAEFLFPIQYSLKRDLILRKQEAAKKRRGSMLLSEDENAGEEEEEGGEEEGEEEEEGDERDEGEGTDEDKNKRNKDKNKSAKQKKNKTNSR
ncbi:hypothetical protein RFI_31212, partial [Reticulomyxa filosa]